MKKKIFTLIIMIIMVFSVRVKAECNDESLNEWVTAIQAKFVLNEELEDPYPYAYFIGLTDYRDDIKIVVYDGKGNKAEGQKFEKTINFYGVGCYTNFEEETYTVNIYGNEKSKCKNELLKTVRYTVPRLNRLRKDALCSKYKDHELCQAFTDATKNMTESEMHEKMMEYDKEQTGEENPEEKPMALWLKALTYVAYIVIPFIVIYIIYLVRVGKFKREEKNR